MPLVKDNLRNALEARLKENFTKGKEEAWSADKAAEELALAIADAIDDYIRDGEVLGVETEVSNPAGTSVIGQGLQSNSVGIT